jgi:hypothetical protein
MQPDPITNIKAKVPVLLIMLKPHNLLSKQKTVPNFSKKLITIAELAVYNCNPGRPRFKLDQIWRRTSVNHLERTETNGYLEGRIIAILSPRQPSNL